MASDLAAADAVLKVGYGDIHDQIEGRDENKLLGLIDRGAKHINKTNTRIEFAARFGRNQGIGARGENEYLPSAGNARDARASYGLKYQYGAIQATGQVFKQVRENSAAFVDYVNREMSDILDTLKKDLNRQVFGDGTGTLAVLATGAAGATTTLEVDDVHWLEVGMKIDVLTVGTLGNPVPTSGITAGTIATITGIDADTNEVTFTGATITAATGSALVRGDYVGAARQNNWKKEWFGLGYLLGGGEVLGIDDADEPAWHVGYEEGSIGSLTELDLTHLLTGVDKQGGKISHFVTSYGVVYAYWSSLQGLRRYDGDQRIAGGVNGMPVFNSIFGPVPFLAEREAPTGVLTAINVGELFLHELGDWAWFDKTGSIWQQVPDKDAWKATTFQYSNLGSFRLNTHGKLSGITEA